MSLGWHICNILTLFSLTMNYFKNIYWLWKWHVHMQLSILQYSVWISYWNFWNVLHKMFIYRCKLYYEDRDWKVANINQLIVERSHNIPKILGGHVPPVLSLFLHLCNAPCSTSKYTCNLMNLFSFLIEFVSLHEITLNFLWH